MKYFLLALVMAVTTIGIIYYYANHDDSLTDDYFAKLLIIKDAEVSNVCINNNLSLLGEGTAFEEYKLSDQSFNLFKNNFESNITNFHRSEYLKKYNSFTPWRQTYAKSNLYLNIKFLKNLPIKGKCFDKERVEAMLNENGNFYCSYFSSNDNDFFIFFLINSNTKSIYVIEKSI